MFAHKTTVNDRLLCRDPGVRMIIYVLAHRILHWNAKRGGIAESLIRTKISFGISTKEITSEETKDMGVGLTLGCYFSQQRNTPGQDGQTLAHHTWYCSLYMGINDRLRKLWKRLIMQTTTQIEEHQKR